MAGATLTSFCRVVADWDCFEHEHVGGDVIQVRDKRLVDLIHGQVRTCLPEYRQQSRGSPKDVILELLSRLVIF